MSSISPLDIFSVVPEPKIFLCIPTSAADNAAVDTNGARRLLVMV